MSNKDKNRNSNKAANTASTIVFAAGAIIFALSAILPYLLNYPLPRIFESWTTGDITYTLLFPNWISILSFAIMAVAIAIYYLLRKKKK